MRIASARDEETVGRLSDQFRACSPESSVAVIDEAPPTMQQHPPEAAEVAAETGERFAQGAWFESFAD